MRVFITGGTGLVGRRLIADRLERGDAVVVLSRNAAKASATFADMIERGIEIIEGDPARAGAWQGEITGCDAVINLAGAGIADRRWNDSYKDVMRGSRIDSTNNIVAAMDAAASPPSVLVNASAVGYYGETGDRSVDESSPAGDDFLSKLCNDWEQAALVARNEATRVALIRMGVVLDARGGAVEKIITPFKCFVGGPIGSGRQYMPWIHWRDLIGILDLALANADASGPINAVAPNAVTNRRFSAALGRALGRPSWLPAPMFALRLALGEFASYLSMSQRVVPMRAIELGYVFEFDDVAAAMYDVVSRKDTG